MCIAVAVATVGAAVSTPKPAHGWFLGAKGQSCSEVCTAQGAPCHQPSMREVDTRSEFEKALSSAIPTDVDDFTEAHFNSHITFVNPSVSLPASDKSLFYNGALSICEAKPAEDHQRICCCNKTGCPTRAAFARRGRTSHGWVCS